MSATPIRRRLPARAVLVAAASLAILAGCTSPQRAPSSYSGAEDNFLEGCQTRATDDADKGKVEIASPKDYCACVWDAITDPKTGISFDRFKEVNSDLTENGGPLPDDVQKAYDGCDPSAGG